MNENEVVSGADRLHAQVQAVLASPNFTDGEKFVVKWQFRLLGDFRKRLIDVITRADDDNLARLALGFPDEVQGFLAWNRGDLGDRLRKAGLDL